MKKDNKKIALLGVLSLLLAVCVLIGAAVLAKINSRQFPVDFPDNNYSDTSSSEEVSSSDTGSSNSSNLNQSDVSDSSSADQSNENDVSSDNEEENVINIATGIYTLNENSIVVTFFEAGFVEGNINCDGITMEFAGQTVDGTLVATSTDSLNNTVEVTLSFEENKITASSKPIIQYEEASGYLSLSGVFVKQGV
ncbi:MAG: hypothetical protein IJ946_05995 [Clostridia bacterium]|nr:hypothetical protein [Clostridia bacterium]